MNEIIIAVKHAPHWMHVLFFTLLVLGLYELKMISAHLVRLALIPLLFIGLWFDALITEVGFGRMTISLSLLGLLFGVGIGWLLVWHRPLQINRETLVFELSGNSSTLVAVVLVYIAKYYYGYELLRDPGLITLTKVEAIMLLTMGICTGVIFGKFAYYVYRFKKNA